VCRHELHEQPRVSCRGLSSPFAVSHLPQVQRHCRAVVRVYVLAQHSAQRHVLRADIWLPKEVQTGLIAGKRSRSVGELLSRLLPASERSARCASLCPLCHSTPSEAGNADVVTTAQACLTPCLACRRLRSRCCAGTRSGEAEWVQAERVAEGMLSHVEPESPSAPGMPYQFKECVMQLPNWMLEGAPLSAAPPLPLDTSLREGAPGQEACLASLPQEVLHALLRHCDDVTAVACTCRYAQDILCSASCAWERLLCHMPRAAVRAC
jgi:hypothetical protein